MKNSKLVIASFTFVAILICTYTALWMFAASKINAALPILNETARNENIEITNFPVGVTGFPAWPKIEFSGEVKIIKEKETNILINNASININLLPTPHINILLPNPTIIKTADLPVDLDISEISLKIEHPEPMPWPISFDTETIQKWQQDNGKIKIQSIKIRRNNFLIEGSGTLNLDKNMQPAMLIESHVKEIEDLFVFMAEEKILDTKSIIEIQKILQIFIRTDEATGENYLPLPIRIQNSGIYAGPVRIGTINEIQWP